MTIENQILKDSVLSCINCHTTIDLNMYAQRSDTGHIICYVVACVNCSLAMKDSTVMLVQKGMSS